MIFLTVGTMDMPFDRLLIKVDNAIKEGFLKDEVFGQIGKSNYIPTEFKSKDFICKEDFDRYAQEADLIISHAGMGSILLAFELNIPIIIMARESKYGEHVNDHQVETANAFRDKSFIGVLYEKDNISKVINNMRKKDCKYKSENTDIKIYKEIVDELSLPNNKYRNVVAGASSGGHLTQLMRILAHDNNTINITTYITSLRLMESELKKKGNVHITGECNRKSIFSIIRVAIKTRRQCNDDNPDLVISTGALPIAIYSYWAYRKGAKIVWVDSIANIHKVSMSGRFIRRFCVLFFTQWKSLEDISLNIRYVGSIF